VEQKIVESSGETGNIEMAVVELSPKVEAEGTSENLRQTQEQAESKSEA
jgi:hypothetical protein